MVIRNATLEEIDDILAIYCEAKKFMRSYGNKTQWAGNYPSAELVTKDVSDGNCFVCVEDGALIGVFCLFDGPDPTYAKIYDGAWPNDRDYSVIHRIAILKRGAGVAEECYNFGLSRKGVLRIDTHRDNKPMQKSLLKNGFERCGIIYLESGDERIAFCKTL